MVVGVFAAPPLRTYASATEISIVQISTDTDIVAQMVARTVGVSDLPVYGQVSRAVATTNLGAPVPVPATIMLFSIGLVGLAGLSRKNT